MTQPQPQPKPQATDSAVLYVAGWNVPGYLPEMTPAAFDDETLATSFLTWEIDQMWDEDYGKEDEPNDIIDSRWLDVHSSLQYETAPFNIQNGDGSLTFWITIVPKSDVPTFDTEGN